MNERELALVRSMMPARGRVLDLGCGTGRLAARLEKDNYDVLAMDTSPEMVRVTRVRADVAAVEGDAFALPLAEGSFDAVVALRLFFHYEDVLPMLREACRVLRPGGSLIFDTYRWSPRALLPLARDRWGGKVFVHQTCELLRQARRLGLALAGVQHCFLFSPYLYRRLPLPIVHALARLESIVPRRFCARSFWTLVRAR